MTADQAIYVSSNPSKQSEGKITTSKKYPLIDFLKQGSLPRGCLGYFVGYVRNQSLLASNCIAAYSTWMADIQPQIRSAPIHDLMIPGRFERVPPNWPVDPTVWGIAYSNSVVGQIVRKQSFYYCKNRRLTISEELL